MEEKAKNFRFFLIFTEKSRKKEIKGEREKGKGALSLPLFNDFYAKSIAACGNQDGKLLAFRHIFPNRIQYARLELKQLCSFPNKNFFFLRTVKEND